MPLSIDLHGSPSTRPRGALRIGLLNNMPDAALESTELQFSRLLQAAAQGRPVQLRLSSMPELVRSDASQRHMQSTYWPLEELLSQSLDGLIVTGTEPRAARLSDEPYWNRLVELVDWADSHTVSTVWSCLAAHAAVQYLDGIERRRLAQKCCGVFEHRLRFVHPLVAGLDEPSLTPHSRWNELPADRLLGAGYSILSESAQCGVNLFVRQRRSLFVFIQGHPEYEDTTLLKEYRRDVGRFLKSEQSHYPVMPHGYFGRESETLLAGFREAAVGAPNPHLLEAFPYAPCAAGLQGDWRPGATGLYRNWLALVAREQPGTVEERALRLGSRNAV